MTSMWLVFLISRARLPGATPKYPARTTPTQLRAFQTSQLYWSRMHIVMGLRSKYFSCTNKTHSFHQYAENMVSTLKHRIIIEKNNESSTEMKICYIHIKAYAIMNHIQYRYITWMPQERHGIPNTGNLTVFFKQHDMANSKRKMCKLSYSRENHLWYIALGLMKPPFGSFVKSMTTKEGLNSPPDRLFVQEYFLANWNKHQYFLNGNIIILNKSFLVFWDKSYTALPLQWRHVIHRWINLKANRHNSYQHIHILTLCKVFAVYFSTTLPLCAFHWHCLRYVASNHQLFNCLFNNSSMPISSVHIIDYLRGRRWS